MAPKRWGGCLRPTSNTIPGAGVFLRPLVATVLLLVTTCASSSTVRPPGGECESKFMQGLFDCFTSNAVPFNSYLWVVGDKSGGVPPKDAADFKEKMCSVEEKVVSCTLDVLHSLVKSDFCKDASGMEALLTVQVHAIFEEYDNYCANGCRQTLEGDLRKCYKDMGLDPTLFLPNASDGAVLGKSQNEVDKFCQKQADLMTCMRRHVNGCSESAYVLGRLGLDLQRLEGGIRLLCDRKDDYLSSLECFTSQTRAVEKCLEGFGQKLTSLVTGNRTRAGMLDKFCLDRMDYVQCDLAAWAEKSSRDCDAKALALKRDFHCNQMSDVCKINMPQLTDKICHPPQALTGSDDYLDSDAGFKTSYSGVIVAFCAILAAWVLFD